MAKKLNRFRVVRGTHTEGGKIFRKGDIVETENDLEKHNAGPGSKKFENLAPPEPAKKGKK